MKKILYLHGFASSGASGTVEILRKEFLGTSESDRVQVVAPDIPVNPADALRDALLCYCELDTLAMVFIWEYFNEVVKFGQ